MNNRIKTVDNVDFKGKKALVRVDFNVPLDDRFRVTDNTRIVAAVPTIKKILADGGAVILMSHLGRPKSGPEDKFSLRHVLTELNQQLGVSVKFAKDCIGAEALQLATDLNPGEVLLLENLRFYKEEEKGDEEFAKKLSALGDIYVNDAFGTAHRAHTSTSIVAKFFADKAAGYLMHAELKNADKVLSEAERPFTAIMGGAKISDKILLIEKLLDKVDNLIATIDLNGQQIDGPTREVMNLLDLKAKWEAFGWEVIVTENGNDIEQVLQSLEKAKGLLGNGKPVLNLLHTEMGYGVDFMVGTHKWHGIAPNDEQLESALAQLEETIGDY
jgi:hypothetical protein